MASSTKDKSTAHIYAKAILELANDSNQAEQIAGELQSLKEIIVANPVFDLFLRDPSITEIERSKSLDRIFRGKISPLLMNTLGVMNEKGRLPIIAALADAYRQLLDAQLGRVKVDVTVAANLDEALLNEVREKVSKSLKKEAIVNQVVDASIIGGLVLKFEDTLIDGSVKSQLELMKKELLAAAN